MIELKIDEKGLIRAQKLLSHLPGAYSRAVKHSLSRTGQKMRTLLNKKTREKYYVNSGEINSTISLKISDHEVQLTSRGARLGLERYKLSPKTATRRKGVVKGAVKRAGGLKSIPKAFIIRLGGKTYPYMRQGKARWDIFHLTSPAIPQILGNEETFEEITPEILDTFNKRLEHEIIRALGGV